MTIALRIERLVREGFADPGTILAVTFTNRAAGELKGRIRDLLSGDAADRVSACTFHAFCARLLRESFGTGFEVVGEEEAAELLRGSGAAGKGSRRARELARRVSEAKREGVGPEEAQADPRFGPEVAAAYRAVRKALEDRGALDFDD